MSPVRHDLDAALMRDMTTTGCTPEQEAAAQRTVASNALDAEDAKLLLEHLGLHRRVT